MSACGLKLLHPMTPKEKIPKKKLIRQEVEDIRHRTTRFLSQLKVLAVSIWQVYWKLERG